MKKLVTVLMTTALFCMTDAQVIIPQSSAFSEVEVTVGLTKVEVEYSRPNKNGRAIFGNLVPYDKVWRTGANKNTTIEFKDDVVIAGQKVKAGEYALFTKPGKESWEIYFYNDTKNWGNPEKWDDSKVVAKATAKVQKLSNTVETFTISLDDLTLNSAMLTIAWDNVKVGTKIEVPTDEKVMASINTTMRDKPTAQDLMSAASYYFAADKDIEQAKRWMDEGMKMNPKPAFYQIYQQALIHLKAGDNKSALALAKQSMAASKEAGSDDYVKLNEELIRKLSK
ncbi:MAG: DUF2911 domain-containing protein [Weeksellaceae bacterium]